MILMLLLSVLCLRVYSESNPFLCKSMQFNKQVKPVLSFNSCAKARINDLKDRLCLLRGKRLICLSDKYRSQLNWICETERQMNAILVNVSLLWKNTLSIEFSPSRKSEAVIVAILTNTFCQKKVVDDLFVGVKEVHADAKLAFNRFLCTCSYISNAELSPLAVTTAENMLTDLRRNVVLINERVSEIHEMCFQFLCALEETLKRIKIVLKQLKILKTTNAVVV